MDIADWRRKIDEVDEQLVRLLNERTKAALEIGKLKKTQRWRFTSPGARRRSSTMSSPPTRARCRTKQLQHIYERIIDVMRTLQQNSK